jgi:hypothetical protein
LFHWTYFCVLHWMILYCLHAIAPYPFFFTNKGLKIIPHPSDTCIKGKILNDCKCWIIQIALWIPHLEKKYSYYYKYLAQTKMPVWMEFCMSSFHTVELNTIMQASQYSPYAIPERTITLNSHIFFIFFAFVYTNTFLPNQTNYTRLSGKSIRFSKCISLCSGYHI